MKIQNQSLTLAPAGGGNVSVTVRYDAAFSGPERLLAQNGLSFHETLVLVGRDAGNDDLVHSFSNPTAIPLPAGAGPVLVSRTIQEEVPRSALQEDPNSADELFAKITVTPSAPAVGDTDDTATVVLPG